MPVGLHLSSQREVRIVTIDHPGGCGRQRKDNADQAPETVPESKRRSLRYDEGAWRDSYRRKDQMHSA